MQQATDLPELARAASKTFSMGVLMGMSGVVLKPSLGKKSASGFKKKIKIPNKDGCLNPSRCVRRRAAGGRGRLLPRHRQGPLGAHEQARRGRRRGRQHRHGARRYKEVGIPTTSLSSIFQSFE